MLRRLVLVRRLWRLWPALETTGGSFNDGETGLKIGRIPAPDVSGHIEIGNAINGVGLNCYESSDGVRRASFYVCLVLTPVGAVLPLFFSR